MANRIEKIREFSHTLIGKTVIIGLVLSLVLSGFGSRWKAAADAPADTNDYTIFSFNNHNSLTLVDNATSVVAGYEHGTLTVNGTGLYSDGTNNVYAPNGSDVTISLTADQDYSGTIWTNGVDTNSTSAEFNNVSRDAGVNNIDATFQGNSSAQATFDYTYSGVNFANIHINSTDLQTPDRDYTNNHTNFQTDYDIAPGDTTVNFTFDTLWIEVIDRLVINNNDYSDQLPKTKDQLANAYNGAQMLTVQIQNVAKADTYTISTNSSLITEEQQFMGNFLWDNDTSRLDDPTLSDMEKDDIIGHGTLEFVKAEYDGATYETVNALNAAGNLFSFWNFNDETSTDGGMTLPVGAMITLRLIPEPGYQLTSFGINGGQFEPQENVGEYTFEIRPGNGHLAAHFTEVEDEVKADESDAVESGTITISDGEIDSGTAKLEVKDVDLDSEDVEGFENAADGYDVKTYLDISLFKTTYKGNLVDSWDEQIDELNHEATITLTLDEGIDGNEIVIVHQKHDGTYEVIPTTYDPATHTITFKTSSFSNYAIATRTVNSPETGAYTTTPTSTGNGVATASIFGGVIAAIVITGVTLKMRKKEEK